MERERIYRVQQNGEIFHVIERGGDLRRAVGDVFERREGGAAIPGGLAGMRVLAPVMPSKIVCVGLNYKDHAAETGKPLPPEPLIFIKPSTAVIGPGDPIRLPPGVGRVDHEAELGIVIGKRAHRVPRAKAWDYIFGLICVNDVTARDLQKKESQYTRCKGFDTFAPIGPCIATGLSGEPRAVEGWVNSERRQSSSTKHLIFPIEQLVEFVTFVMTLEPGDIISTGTPEGIGPLKHGDAVKVMVEGVGELVNPVQDE
ncbi:MAG TPA: fumarylacetoacetate hydrolase family protein [Vicinamibacterales bacterium]|jgi:2-keto-4-pentenoate hydratase/2-oxohepta-3-ene-1,7-dioic acid hydratase in catechol pathway|nr:fumarylacetoacetate hydrolase family protein [Vicinamibacterales bacterium]